MFLVGLELDMSVLRGREWVAGAISMGSIVVPFGFGVLLALYLYPRRASVVDPDIDKLTTVLFFGVAMSITAFPVLARILADRRIQAFLANGNDRHPCHLRRIRFRNDPAAQRGSCSRHGS